MSMTKNLPAFVFSGASLCFVPVAAYSQPADPEAAGYELSPIVVTPTLSHQTVGESLSSVTVIDEETIRRQQPLEFSELLLGQPGVDLTENGSFGKNTSVFMRGTGSESTVLLVDGIRLRSATSGSAPWAFLPPQLLERVEIVRGPRSSLYGADAVGGVIQAFTHAAEDEPEGWVSAGGGTHDSQEVGAGVAGKEDAFSYSFSVNHFETDGAEIIEGGEDKGYRNTAGLGRVSHHFDNGGQAGVLLMRAQGNTEYDDGETDFTVQTLGLYLDAPLGEHWVTRLQFAESRDESESIEDGDASVFDTLTRSARWENHIFAGPHEFTVGTELLVDEVDSTLDFEEDSRTNTALFAQALFDFGQPDLQVSFRSDDNEAYGRNQTGAVALGYALDDHHRVRTSYGTSFRAPTFNDLYYPGYGNPDLESEEAETFEIGVSGHYSAWFWDLVAYQSNVENLIVPTFRGGSFAPFNVAEARIRGIELSSGFVIDQWTLRASASLIDPENEETDSRIRRRSGEQFRLDVDREQGEFTLGATVKGQGHRYDDADEEDRIAGFTTLDLRAGWHFAESWTARVNLDNVLDKQYATARRFNGADYISAGLTAFASVRYDFR